MESQEYEVIEKRLHEVEVERAALLESLKTAKRDHRYSGKRLDLDKRVYPKTSDERVELFEKMFAARKDVFPQYWENPSSGEKGYSPVCEPIWANGRRLKATEVFARYGNSKFKRLDRTVLEAHLRGKQTVGTYTIRPDNTCIFLAADFDKDGWQQEVNAYRDTAAKMGITVLVEISRSGNGAHGWIFFTEPVPASEARILGSLLLAQIEASRPSSSLQSFDRLFPNQDEIPKGGFGNLIALPLQKARRQYGYTEFVDDSLRPYDDPWKILAEVPRLSPDELREILNGALGTPADEADPLELESLILETTSPSCIDYPVVSDQQVSLAEDLIIPTQSLPPAFVAKLQALARFPNPVFFEKQRQRFPTYNIPRRIFGGELHPDRLVLPRGCIDDCVDLFAESGSRLDIVDRRLKPKKISIKFTGELKPAQREAVNAIKRHEHGVLVAPPGTGKTVMGCALIGIRKIPTLILVHRQTLSEQWKSRLMEFLNIDSKQIGILQGAKKRLKGLVDIASVQTLTKRDDLKQLFREYGMVIIDECHHVPSVTLENVMKACGSRYILGLTATPKRKDGLEQLLFLQCGPIRHIVPNLGNADQSRHVIVTRTEFCASDENGMPLPLHLVWDKLIHSEPRNTIIAEDIVKLNSARAPLILSDRKEHIKILMRMVEAKATEEILLCSIDGSLSARKRNSSIDAFKTAIASGKKACLFSTASLIGEGFDLPELDTLFLAMPVSFRGRIIQYAGRLHRSVPGKSEVQIFDYLDYKLSLGNSMYRKRSAGYREMGYKINEPEDTPLI